MACGEYIIMINEFLDDELSKNKEILLFTHLSQCQECREEFKDQNLIQNTLKMNQNEVSAKLEEKIFNSVKNSKKGIGNIIMKKTAHVYANYVLSIVILIIILFSIQQIKSLRNDLSNITFKYETALDRIEYQSQQINLLFNNTPAVRITRQPVRIIN